MEEGMISPEMEMEYISLDDLNSEKFTRVMRAIVAWGELLVELRLTQPEYVVREARMQACLAVI